MSAFAMPMVGYHICAPDRSVGPIGAVLRGRLQIAVAPPPVSAERREDVVLARVLSALEDAD
ncbi:MAG: hypothetical protein AB7P34_00430, partial [Vicinamibacterales bacterium]